LATPGATPLHAINTNQNLIGLVNGSAISIHHIVRWASFCPVAFIFDECARAMVNPRFIGKTQMHHKITGVNPMLNRVCLKGA
jgi:hypothetical protein